MQKIAACLFTALILCTFFLANPVRADIAPPPAPHGGNIVPGEPSTHVRMMAETVLIEALPNSGIQPPVGKVSASFQMRNMGEEAELMMVRFPLSLILGGTPCEAPSDYKSVQNFKAWVNEQLAPVTIDRYIPSMGSALAEEMDCWANFPATFPIGEDVYIRVSYTQEAGMGGSGIEGYVSYPYVIHTGSGWFGTIGSVDITFRAPWVLDGDTYLERGGASDRIVVGNEVRWHYENYDPDEFWEVIEVTIVNPAVWSSLLDARRDTVLDPQDGEAWGRMGKALKEMTLMQKGIYREDYYLESYAAYQKAVELKPWDADWHFGFGELLYSQAMWPMLSGTPPTDDFARDSLLQFKAALEINPRHEKTIKYLMYEYPREWVSQYGLDVYLNPALTEVSATETKQIAFYATTLAPFHWTETAAFSPSSTPLPTRTRTPKTTTLTQTRTPLVIAEVNQTLTTVPTQSTPASPAGGGGVCGSILITITFVIVFSLWRWKTGM